MAGWWNVEADCAEMVPPRRCAEWSHCWGIPPEQHKVMGCRHQRYLFEGALGS